MAIIYTYPVKTTPANNDLILISDSEAEDPKKATKQIKVSSLPGGSAAGVSSFNTLTGAVTITGGTNVTLNTVGNNIEINAAGGASTSPSNPVNSVQFNNAGAFGGSANLTFSTNTLAVTHTVDIKGDGTNAGKLKLYCENTTTPHAVTIEGPAHSGAAAYTLKLPSPAPSNQQILQSDGSGVLSWINTPSSGGGGSVDSVNTTDGTFINLTPNSATTGAVTVTADLSAVDGTSDTTTRFLSKDNTWDVPSYTTNTDTTYSAGTGLSLVSTTFSLASGAALTNLGGGSGTTFLKKDGTWATPTDNNTNIYTTNGTLGANRTVTMGSNTLTFSNSSGQQMFQWDPTTYTYKVGNSVNSLKGTIRIDGNGGGNRGGVLELEEGGSNNYHVQIKGPDSMSASYDITLPAAQGGSNTFLKNNGSGDLTWATVSSSANTNIANSNLTLDNNRTLDFYDGSNSRSLTFVSTASGGSKNLFKFEAAGGTAPTMYAGNTESAYEGYIILEGNGSNRTGQLKFENAAGTYSTAFKAVTSQSADITYTLPATIGTQNQVLEISSVSGGNATLGWAAAGSGGVSSIIAGTNVTISSTGSGGTGDVTINASGSGSGGSLGFAPLEIYAANTNSTASYIYYMVAVCDVDFTVNKCKVAVTSGTDPVYVAVYSMTTGNIQSATLSKLGALQKTSSVATGVNELSLAESAFSLTAGQTICIGISTACQLASGSGINNTALGLMATSGGGSALPNSPDFEGLGSANARPAIHFYAS